jgi:hypothetical protein
LLLEPACQARHRLLRMPQISLQLSIEMVSAS